LIFPGIADNSFREKRKSVVVSDSDGFLRIMELMKSSATRSVIAGRVSISPDDMKEEVLGNIAQLSEVIRINRIREVIYCTRNLNASQIIDSMHIISGQNISVRIASADEKYLLGSKYDNPEAGKLTDVEPSPGMKIARIIKGLFR
jgi:hypothetical protein